MMYRIELKTAEKAEADSEMAALDQPEAWLERTRRACLWRGLMKAEAAAWVAPILLRGVNKPETTTVMARQVIAMGEPISKERKKELGMGRRPVVGHLYVEALTKAGLAKATKVAELICGHALGLYYQEARRLRALRRQESRPYCQLLTIDDGRTCTFATGLSGTIFLTGNEPHLPLPECDAERCRCTFTYRSDRDLERMRAP